jgi:hypothetical protein
MQRHSPFCTASVCRASCSFCSPCHCLFAFSFSSADLVGSGLNSWIDPPRMVAYALCRRFSASTSRCFFSSAVSTVTLPPRGLISGAEGRPPCGGVSEAPPVKLTFPPDARGETLVPGPLSLSLSLSLSPGANFFHMAAAPWLAGILTF